MKFLINGGDAAGMIEACRPKRPEGFISVMVPGQTCDVPYSACNIWVRTVTA